MDDSTSILLISGSLRGGSTNTAMLRTARAVAPAGISASLYEGMDGLPHFNPDDDLEGGQLAAPVAALRARLREVAAVLICTPEYAGALPGALKNLLEWTVGGGELYGKSVAWINASGRAAPKGGADAHESLRKVLGYVGADIVEDACVRIPVARDAIGPDGLIADSLIRARAVDCLRALAEHAG